jgi:hypothetical protein
MLGHLPTNLNCNEYGQVTIPLLTLDTTDPRLELEMLPSPTLQLLTCRTHFQTAFQYSFTTSGKCLPIGNVRSGFSSSPTDDVVAASPPKPILLHAIPDRVGQSRALAKEGRIDEAEGWAKRFAWDQPQHQIGGLPFRLSRTTSDPKCSLCGLPMPFLAAAIVDVRNGLNEETGFGQELFYLCRTCACVAVVPDFKTDAYS